MAQRIALTIGGLTAGLVLAGGLMAAGFGPTQAPASTGTAPLLVPDPVESSLDAVAEVEGEVMEAQGSSAGVPGIVFVRPDGSTLVLGEVLPTAADASATDQTVALTLSELAQLLGFDTTLQGSAVAVRTADTPVGAGAEGDVGPTSMDGAAPAKADRQVDEDPGAEYADDDDDYEYDDYDDDDDD
jgi:hypothetical protein